MELATVQSTQRVPWGKVSHFTAQLTLFRYEMWHYSSTKSKDAILNVTNGTKEAVRLISSVSNNCCERSILNIDMSVQHCVLKVIVNPWHRLKGHSLWHWALPVVLPVYLQQGDNDWSWQTVLHCVLPHFTQWNGSLAPACPAPLLHHFNHSWLTAQLEQAQEWGMEGREGWCEVDVTQANGEISAEM